MPVLKDCSLQVLPGQTVALVGASGCGKSTVVGLLQRFYNPNIGWIYLDEQEVSAYNLAWLRSQVYIFCYFQ